MIQKKVCMLGAFAVGKTSLVSRFVTQGFSEKYQVTIGVKIDKKTVTVGNEAVDLILWDVQGEDNGQQFYLSYLRGLSGYLLVVDGTRRSTLETAKEIQATVASLVEPQVPFIALVNKRDVEGDWQVSETDLEELAARSWEVIKTSAKTGEGVEAAFERLTLRILGRQPDGTSAGSV